MFRALALGVTTLALAQPALAFDKSRDGLNGLIAMHASANGVPVSLVHRVIVRESRYNARAIGRGGAMGLMQIKHATACGVGYTGSAAGLLDPAVNLTYAVKYLAGAYRVAGGNHDQAVALYARGYYSRGNYAHAQRRRSVFASASGWEIRLPTWDSRAAAWERTTPRRRNALLGGRPEFLF